MVALKRTWKHFVVMPYRSPSPEGRINDPFRWPHSLDAHHNCSDTVSLTLIYLFYRLARHPEQLRKLQIELDSLDSVSDFTALQQAPHLNGIINETMRLHPATLTANVRQTPPEGAMISGKFVPGGIVICSPRYIIGKRQYSTHTRHNDLPLSWIPYWHKNPIKLNHASSAPKNSSPNAGTANQRWSKTETHMRLLL